jgi:hypothetical protein
MTRTELRLLHSNGHIRREDRADTLGLMPNDDGDRLGVKTHGL